MIQVPMEQSAFESIIEYLSHAPCCKKVTSTSTVQGTVTGTKPRPWSFGYVYADGVLLLTGTGPNALATEQQWKVRMEAAGGAVAKYGTKGLG